jgi:hypothetical protein
MQTPKIKICESVQFDEREVQKYDIKSIEEANSIYTILIVKTEVEDKIIGKILILT